MSNENEIFCTKCGTKNNTTDSFCINCGNRLSQEESRNTYDSNRSINQNTYAPNYVGTKEMDMFISKNTEYYNQKFNLMNSTGKKASWNWSVFFCGIYWFLYRKMYVQAVVIFAGNSIMAMIPFIGSIISLLVPIILGMYGNSVYLDHMNKSLNEIDVMGYQPREDVIMKKGGVNKLIPIIAIIVTLLSIFFILILGISLYDM